MLDSEQPLARSLALLASFANVFPLSSPVDAIIYFCCAARELHLSCSALFDFRASTRRKSFSLSLSVSSFLPCSRFELIFLPFRLAVFGLVCNDNRDRWRLHVIARTSVCIGCWCGTKGFVYWVATNNAE